jgi:hypothetical protein
MYRWQQKKQKKKMRNAVVWPSLTSLRWAERFMMMMTTRVDGAQFRLALLFSSWTTHTHPAANINNDGRLVWKQEKKKNIRSLGQSCIVLEHLSFVCLLLTRTWELERTNGRTDNSVAATCVFIVAMATPHRSNQPNQIDYSPLSVGRCVNIWPHIDGKVVIFLNCKWSRMTEFQKA